MSNAYNGDTSSWFTERFQNYSKRIVSFSLKHPYESPSLIADGRCYHVNQSVFTAWSNAPGGFRTIFPQARQLNYTGDTKYYVVIAAKIIALNLRVIKVNLIGHTKLSDIDTYGHDEFFRLILPHTCNLEFLSVYSLSILATTGSKNTALSELVIHTTQLQEFRTNIPLTPEAVLHLARLPSLKKLCDLETSTISQTVSQQPERLFPGIHSLQLCSPFPEMTHTVAQIASSSIRTIQLRVSDALDAKNFLAFLGACSIHRTLEDLSTVSPSPFISHRLQLQDIEGIILALRNMTGLHSFEVGGFSFPILDTDIASQLLNACSQNLRSLNAYHLSPVTWGLLYRALASRSWQAIPFGLCFEPTPPPRLSVDSRFAHESVRILHVAGNPGSDESKEEWADILRIMFPNLKSVLVHPEEQDFRNWTEITTIASSMGLPCRTDRRMACFDLES
jgi:hypothetical protein